jgi:hypothetical protein
VRGGDLDIDLIRSDAAGAHARFGEYGISVFGAADEAAVDVLARDRLTQFEILVLMTAGAIRRAGLELRPTFRRPHCTIMLRAGPGHRSTHELRKGPKNQSVPWTAMSTAADIDIDWNEEDDTGLPWTFVARAIDPSKIIPGAYVIAGRGTSLAVAEVVDVGDDGVVHLQPLPGPVSLHEHLLARSA